MTATITRPKSKKAAAKAQSPYKRLHVIIPIEDMLWVSQQKPSVNQLWQECWTADPYGSRWMPLTSALGYSTFISAKKILSDSGLFIFKPDKSIQDGRETASWMVKNLHGSRMKEFWEKANAASPKPDAEKQEPNSEKRESNTGDSEIDAGCEEMRALYKASISGESQSEKEFQETSRTTQEQFTNSSKEFVNCVSDTLNEILPYEETAHAPLGGASPQTVESVSEKEKDSPTANDCTSLTLVEAVQGESAWLLAENQDCGVEPRDCHEGTGSAAPPAQIEKSSNSAIADQKIEPSRPSAELMTENSVSGVEIKTVDEGETSAAPVPQSEKWSHEAIVARSNMRPERMQKLKVAANSGENPGFDFLQECWNDDPALLIAIKKQAKKQQGNYL
jgi:myosin heavy subunit